MSAIDVAPEFKSTTTNKQKREGLGFSNTQYLELLRLNIFIHSYFDNLMRNRFIVFNKKQKGGLCHFTVQPMATWCLPTKLLARRGAVRFGEAAQGGWDLHSHYNRASCLKVGVGISQHLTIRFQGQQFDSKTIIDATIYFMYISMRDFQS